MKTDPSVLSFSCLLHSVTSSRFGFSRHVALSPLIIALIIGLPGCHKPKPAQEQQAEEDTRVVVTLGPVVVHDVQRTVEVVGTLFGDEESTISAKVSGRVVEVFHDIGDQVKPGEALARIDATDYTLTVAQRQASLIATLAEIGLDEIPPGNFAPELVPTVAMARLEQTNAQAKHRRAKAMFEEVPPLLAEQDYNDRLTAYQVAQQRYDVAVLNARAVWARAQVRAAELSQAKQSLEDTIVRAPVDQSESVENKTLYSVATRFVSQGEYIQVGAPMFHLIDPNPIKFRAKVPERYLDEIALGLEVDITVQAYDEPFYGQVTRVSPQINENSRTFLVEVSINNTAGLLRSGGFASGSIKTHIENDVMFVPQEAVVTYIGISKIFAIRNQKATEFHVTTGVWDGDLVEVITDELQLTDEVAISGTSHLAQSVPVDVKSASELTAPVIDPSTKKASGQHGTSTSAPSGGDE